MKDYRFWTDARLREAVARAETTGDGDRRLRASLALLPTHPGQADYLWGRLLDADLREAAVILRCLADSKHLDANQGGGVNLLTDTVKRSLDAEKTDADKEKLAKQQANAAVALLRMGKAELVWPLLAHPGDGFDPRTRSHLIHRLAPLGVDIAVILGRLTEEKDVTIRRALILSLGEYGGEKISRDALGAALLLLVEMTGDTDPGLQAASEWLLRNWELDWMVKGIPTAKVMKKEEDKACRAALAPGAKPQWYVNGQGQTMVVIPGPVTFRMGSPLSETEGTPQTIERQHRRRIGRTFALASKLVTLEQYRKFHHHPLEAGSPYARMADLPVLEIDWYMAAVYCNWLSEEEKIEKDQWCYEIGVEEVKLRKNYLSLKGYRLPTEAELEYATRAGAVTSRYYGEADELLAKYAWYQKNSDSMPWPVGRKKPNDLGFFDLQGNAYSWCQEHFDEYPPTKGEEVAEDREDGLLDTKSEKRVLRGGGFDSLPRNLRSAYRSVNDPTAKAILFGFRPARTITP